MPLWNNQLVFLLQKYQQTCKRCLLYLHALLTLLSLPVLIMGYISPSGAGYSITKPWWLTSAWPVKDLNPSMKTVHRWSGLIFWKKIVSLALAEHTTSVPLTSVFGKDWLNANSVIRWSGDVDGVPEVDAPLISYSDCEAQVTGGSGSMLHEVIKRPFHLQQKQTRQP